MSTSRRHLPLLNILAFILTLVVNFLSSAGVLNNRTTQEISDSLPSFFTPAGFTFAVWGVIYLGLAAFVVYQALPGQRNNPYLQRIGWWFVISSLANIAWIFAWHWGLYVLTVPAMLLLLVSLLIIYTRLGVGLPASARPYPVSRADRWLIDTPFGLYAAWITVANIANIATTLVSLNWGGFGISGPVWAAIMILVAAVVATLVLIKRTDFAFAGVILWALFGIWSKQGGETIIAIAAIIAFVVVAIAAVLGWRRSHR
ncbi:MAG: tryptophan-rich sensory protein [Caldilineales bacterium]|nr:tryptophan-rich sensory protein [Caldilineales bacterium]MCW5856760.1 tryptophan-rich sensory protein [Caldilineales bacterium]